MSSTDTSPLYSVYKRSKLSFKHGRGSWLTGDDSRFYLDFASGVAVNVFGHGHPALVRVLETQAKKIWHLSNIYTIPEQIEFAKLLCKHSFADKVFFTNSGTEAIECALKTARRYHFSRGNPERYEFIAFNGGFHGRTYGALSAGSEELYREGFRPTLEGFKHVPFGDFDAVLAAVGPQSAAIIIEPIQGESGIQVAEFSFLKKLRQLCDEKNLLLIYDEVQCGMGRTGKLFAHEWSNIPPDIMALSKGIGAGFPLGACLAIEKVATEMIPGTHGSTFGGNLLAMAVGQKVLELLLEKNRLTHVTEMGKTLKVSLENLQKKYPKIIKEVRGYGLMLGIQLFPQSNLLKEIFEKMGLLTVLAGNNVLRLLPPLNISEEEINLAVDIMERSLRGYSNVTN